MVKNERNRQLYYADGNTVRKVVEPVERPKRPSIAPTEREREIRRENRRSYRKADDLEMSLPYVAFLLVMVVMIVMSCVKYLDMNFKPQTGKFFGWTAEIIQHEIDHCNGILI